MSNDQHPSEAAMMNKTKPVDGRNSHHQPSRGFTLIELIIVIGVIALLLSTGLLVMGNVLQSAREKATMATITKINGMLQQRAEALQRYLEKPSNLKAERDKSTKFFNDAKLPTSRYASFPPIPRPDHAQEAVLDILTRLRITREALPQSFEDIYGPDRYPGTVANDDGGGATNFLPSNNAPDINELGVGANHGDALAFVKAIQALKAQVDLSKHTPETESSELLYLALTAAESFGVPPVGQDEFSTSEVKDTDGDGLAEFIDAWGRPLRFYRSPTRLLRCGEDAFTGDTNGNTTTDGAGPNAWPDPRYANLVMSSLPSLKINDKTLVRDSNDGFGRVVMLLKQDAQTPADLVNLKNNFEFWFYTLDTHYSMLVVSAGPDGVLGLYEPGDSLPPTAGAASPRLGHLAQPTVLGDPSGSPLADNVTNRKQ
jgi:prepilin-type N-terminal cleavage/methylation domain-containing protein